jgi:large subunit ribosomal protein L29
MKIGELREMSDEQLQATLTETKDTLFRLRIRAQTERLDAPSEMRKQRRLIARILTLRTERSADAAASKAAATHAGLGGSASSTATATKEAVHA